MELRDARCPTASSTSGTRTSQRDPLGQVRRIYAFVGRELTAEMEARDAALARDEPARERPPHEYSLEQFGFTEAGIEEYFSEYRRRFVAGRA